MIVLYYVFNMLNDCIVWDVGYQIYLYKILMGCCDQMYLLCQYDGILGFLCCSEFEYDMFGIVYLSMLILVVFGMVIGSQLNGDDCFLIVVIGDGVMMVGMVFEVMNNVGVLEDVKLFVIFNDNDMLILLLVGVLNCYFVCLMLGCFYVVVCVGVECVLSVVLLVFEFVCKFEEYVKGMVVLVMLFEEFGFNYIGLIDGYDFDLLILMLQNICELCGLQFLYVVMKKGQGYKFVEVDFVFYYGFGKFNLVEGIKLLMMFVKKMYMQVFGEWLCDEVECDMCVVGIMFVMCEGLGMVEFEKCFKDCYYDVGIVEQYVVMFVGGFVIEGLKFVVVIYLMFLQCVYDQLIYDVVLQNLLVVFVIDCVGFVGVDGVMYVGVYDFVFMCCILNMMIMVVFDENECCQMLYMVLQQLNLIVVCYLCGVGMGVVMVKEFIEILFGKGEVCCCMLQLEGKCVVIFVFGMMVVLLFVVVEEFDVMVVNMCFVKLVDVVFVCEFVEMYDYVVMVEEGCVMGGVGLVCVEVLMESGVI